MASIEDTLRNLRDVQGVYGSFVIAGTGALVAKDLPDVFDGNVFAEVGPRITRLWETLLSGGEDLDACVLRYLDHKVYLRRMTWGLIGVISGVTVNMPALRMVANLVIRRIDPDVTPSLRPTGPPAASERPLIASGPPPSLRPPVVPPMPPAPMPPAPTPVTAIAPALTVTAIMSPPVRGSMVSGREALASAADLDDSPGARDSSPPPSDRHVRMYRGRRVVDE
jgi:predicted regulator of Ras-like GTPase activity (Roadblock/LC7/MglB family)